MRLTLIAPLTLVNLMGVLPAAATGTLDCSVREPGVAIDVHGVVPYGMSAGLLQVEAEIEARLPGIAPDLSRTRFSGEHQIQFWLDDVSLNILFYREREATAPFGATKLVIKTSRTRDDEEGTYLGTYDIQGYEVPEDGSEAIDAHAQGAITCMAG